MKAIFLSARRPDRSVCVCVCIQHAAPLFCFFWGAIHHALRAAGRLLGFVPMLHIQTHKKDILRSVESKL